MCVCVCVCLCVCVHILIPLTLYTPIVVVCYTEMEFPIDISERASPAVWPGLARVPINKATSFVISSAANNMDGVPVTITCKWTISLV